MSKFKVGDRVQIITKVDRNFRKLATIMGKDSYYDWTVQIDDGKSTWFENDKDIIKIGGSMSKYDELRDRIRVVQAWDKEADDIRREIGLAIVFKLQEDSTSGYGHLEMMRRGYTDTNKSFSFTSQCSKLSAFKQALLWLLNHSDIKKDLVGQEVKAEVEGKTYRVKILGKL